MSYADLARLGVTVRPLDGWPGTPTSDADRIASPFEATFAATISTLERELRMLDAAHIVIMLDIAPGAIRVDGLPRSDAKCRAPGVVLAFDSKVGPLRYACDRFIAPTWRRTLLDWQHNLRAIALGLEALRKVQRYGIADDAQQYRGYAQLPSGIAQPATHMTTDDAARFIADHANRANPDGPPRWAEFDLDTPERLDRAYRAAAKRLHPDRPGGDAALFQRLQTARDLLAKGHR